MRVSIQKFSSHGTASKQFIIQIHRLEEFLIQSLISTHPSVYTEIYLFTYIARKRIPWKVFIVHIAVYCFDKFMKLTESGAPLVVMKKGDKDKRERKRKVERRKRLIDRWREKVISHINTAKVQVCESADILISRWNRATTKVLGFRYYNNILRLVCTQSRG